MDKDELIKQQQREIERYQTLLRDAENGLDITSKPEMSIDDILSSFMFLFFLVHKRIFQSQKDSLLIQKNYK